MFTRDLPLGVMPIGGTRSRSQYAVTVEPENPRVTLWLANLLDADARRGEFADVLAEFVETATQYLAHFGEVFYEVIPSPCSPGPVDKGKLAGEPAADQAEDEAGFDRREPLPLNAALCNLPPGKVWWVPSRYLQVVPKGDRKRIGKRFVAISSARIWRLTLPDSLGSPRAHRKRLKRLGKLDPLRPDFVMETLDMGRSVGFDFTLQRSACDIEQERITRKWGRILSITHIEGTTEYLFLARALQWRLTQAMVREHVITELNGLLDCLRVGYRIVVSGLPSATAIADALEQMQAGKITVSAAMDVAKM